MIYYRHLLESDVMTISYYALVYNDAPHITTLSLVVAVWRNLSRRIELSRATSRTISRYISCYLGYSPSKRINDIEIEIFRNIYIYPYIYIYIYSIHCILYRILYRILYTYTCVCAMLYIPVLDISYA